MSLFLLSKQPRSSRTGRVARLGAVAAAVGVVLGLLSSAPASAQQAAAPAPAALKARVNLILKQPQDPSAEERQILDDYFVKSYFPAMTDASPEQLGKLAVLRKDLVTQFLNAKGSQAAHDYLLAITMKSVGQSIAIRNYHPAIRYNAVLIIGQLDKEVAKGGTADPVPFADATKALIVMLEKDEFFGVPVTSPVKLAALVGLDRHTRLGVDPQLAERITSAALAIATRQERPEDVSSDVHDWMRRLAVRILTNQQEKGLTAPAFDAVAKLVGSKQINLDDRCGIAELLKAPMFQGAQGIDPETMAQALGRFAPDVTAFEAKEAKQYQKDLLGDDGGAGMVGGGFGGQRGGMGLEGGFNPEGGFGGFQGGMGIDPAASLGPHIEKRRLLDRLKAVADAADAFGAVAGSDETKKRMTDLAEPLRTAFDDAVANDAVEMDIAKSMIALARDIEDLVDEWAPAEPADAGDEEEAVDLEAPAEEPAADAEAVPDAEAEPAEAPPAAEPAPAEAAGN